MNLQTRRLLSLLDYAQESMRTRARVVSNVAEHGGFLLFDHELADLEGIGADSGYASEDDVWVSIPHPDSPEVPPVPDNSWLVPWLSVGMVLQAQPGLADEIDGASLIAVGTHRDCARPATDLSTAANPMVDARARILLNDYPFRGEVEKQYAYYLQAIWKPWSQREQRRRRISKLYAKLFTLQQQLSGALTGNQLELVWGMAIAKRKSAARATSSQTSVSDQAISENAVVTDDYPLVTCLVDIGFNEETRAAEIRPRNIDARIELDVFVSPDHASVTRAEQDAMRVLMQAEQAVTPFDPESYAALVEIAREAIEEASGQKLDISKRWVIFARPRGNNLAMHDLERMRNAVTAHGDAPFPGAINAILTNPDDSSAQPELPVFRGNGATYRESMTSVIAEDLFFPKPFNDEQARVAQQLEVSDGVVVQGPPGTGKSHTIANVICHWLANGRRVLVTSMRDPALSVLRDQLPEAIRPLAVSLLASEKEGIEQLEYSIGKIASEVQSLSQDVLREEIERLENAIDLLQGKLARLDRDLTRWAKLNLLRIDLQGQSIEPQDAAREVMDNAGEFEWIPDPLGVGPQFAPQFDMQDIVRLRRARKRLGVDIEHAGDNLPQPGDLPGAAEVAKAHDALLRFTRVNERSRATELPWPVEAGAEALIAAREMARRVQDLQNRYQKIFSSKLPWSDEAVARIRRRDPADVFNALDTLSRDIQVAVVERTQFFSRPVHVPDAAFVDKNFLQALDNVLQGRRAFSFAAFGKTNARRQMQGVLVNGVPPCSTEEWQHVANYVAMHRKRRELTARWNALAPELGFQIVLSTEAKGQLSVESQFALYNEIKLLAQDQRALVDYVSSVFPDWSQAASLADDPGALDRLADTLDYHLTRSSLHEVSGFVENARRQLETASGSLADAMRAFLTHRLGKPMIDESAILSGWNELIDELKRLQSLAEPLAIVKDVTRRIYRSGGEKLAVLLNKREAADTVELLPDTFLRDWRLRRLATHISAIDSQAESRMLNELRTGIERDLSRMYEELVVKRTWFKLAQSVTPGVRAALQGYLNAIQRIGKGTGKRAQRYRQDARYAAAEAYKALPCWIMPHHRISETLPAELGCFDLVVIDESSQSDLSALPILMRAKKILIVGDDRQVSPQAIGMDEDRVRALMQRHLADQVPIYRAQLAPDRSFYDLAKVVFAKSTVMLREHFRCVAPIIEYARREFYNYEIYPLRLPRHSERIDPPLQDVHITNGVRKNGINEQEVDFIVGDIVRRTQDEKLQTRSIGVVSLLGSEQALRIWNRLLDQLGPELIRRHDITCGDARMFQGRERDIMYLSMVAAPNDIGAPLGRETFAQRFNVASSRARDQMILVRSVDLNQLSEADRLRRDLIRHFVQPFGEVPVKVAATPELCESQFERDIFNWLAANGYRVMPQVRVGAYKVDLVVEGDSDTRLAVECDGDKSEGAEHWMQAIRRQRALERTGWVFWRCFATSFVRRKDEVLEDLRQALDAQGIQPTRSGGWARRKVTETRQVQAGMPVTTV